MREAASRGFWMTTYAPTATAALRPGRRQKAPSPGTQPAPRRRGTAYLRPHPPGQDHPGHPQDPQPRRAFPPLTETGGPRPSSTRSSSTKPTPAPWSGEQMPRTARTRCGWRTPSPPSSPNRSSSGSGSCWHPAPQAITHPRRAASPYLLSGLAKCETCGKALSASEAKSGKYTYYVCQSILKLGSGSCETPRLNAKSSRRSSSPTSGTTSSPSPTSATW